jgi:hypothetical protein
MGFCGLDRRREPLRGDEVRACWEDGAVAPPAEPSVPGLLDLLTVHTLGETEAADQELRPDGEERRPPRPVPRLRSLAPARDWVEVDVQAVEL